MSDQYSCHDLISSLKVDVNELTDKSNIKLIYASSIHQNDMDLYGLYRRQNINDFPDNPYLKKIDGYKDLELENILKNCKGLKIGISWKSFKNRYASEKSLTLNNFQNIIDIQDSSIFNLQYGDINNELKDKLQDLETGIHLVLSNERMSDEEKLELIRSEISGEVLRINRNFNFEPSISDGARVA